MADAAGAGEGEAAAPLFPLHQCVFRGDVAELSALIRRLAGGGGGGDDKSRILAAQERTFIIADCSQFLDQRILCP